jgi:hypothetical protein
MSYSTWIVALSLSLSPALAQASPAQDAPVEVRITDATLPPEAQDAQLRASLDEAVAAYETIRAELEPQLDDPTKAQAAHGGLGHAIEQLGRSIADSEIPSYMTADQALVYQRALDDKGAKQLAKAAMHYLAAGERAMDADQAAAALGWFSRAKAVNENPELVAFVDYKSGWCLHALDRAAAALERMEAAAASGIDSVAPEAQAALPRMRAALASQAR